MNMFLMIIRRFFIVFFGLGLCVLLSAFLVPPLLDGIERITGTPLSYESALRVYITFSWAIFLLGWLWWLLRHGEYRGWTIFGIVSIGYVATLAICIGDRNHILMEEFSWIRYTTTIWLISAALCAFFLVRQQWRADARWVGMTWGLLGGGLLYGGLDEVFEIHEKIGKAIETTTGFSHEITDYVTVAYAGILIVVLLFSCKMFFSLYRSHQASIHLLFLGSVFYFFSTMFDTFDVVAIKKLTSLAKVLGADPSFVFLDAWYMFWSPKNFFNGFEEIFEQTAAMLFFIALFLISADRRIAALRKTRSIERKLRFGQGCMIIVCVLLLIDAAVAGKDIFSPSVLYAGSAHVIAGPMDGLFHTDDLEYSQEWGVVVANEGKGNVYQWKDERWRKIPDKNNSLKDVDSIAIAKHTLTVADGSQGAIFSYQKNKEWMVVASKEDGLKHPEDFVVFRSTDGDMYTILDESEKSVISLFISADTSTRTSWRPDHPKWVTPEGIVSAKTSGEYYVTDDTSGAIFLMSPEKKAITQIAQLSNPEDIEALSDGNMLVSDNAWGAVFRIQKDGSTQKVFQFKRPYRDLQGVTVDEQGRIYVITADGHDKTSFMPSFLFRIDGML